MSVKKNAGLKLNARVCLVLGAWESDFSFSAACHSNLWGCGTLPLTLSPNPYHPANGAGWGNPNYLYVKKFKVGGSPNPYHPANGAGWGNPDCHS